MLRYSLPILGKWLKKRADEKIAAAEAAKAIELARQQEAIRMAASYPNPNARMRVPASSARPTNSGGDSSSDTSNPLLTLLFLNTTSGPLNSEPTKAAVDTYTPSSDGGNISFCDSGGGFSCGGGDSGGNFAPCMAPQFK